MQFAFGSGVFWGTPLQDSDGNAIATPTPVQLGVLQDLSIDISFDTKTLYGQQQFPVAVGRGKGKLSGKSKAAQLSAVAINSLVFGQTLTAGEQSMYYDVAGSAVPAAGPYTITPTPPKAGAFIVDLGVRNANSVPMTAVATAGAVTAGTYHVSSGGVYTFAAADKGAQVYISYQYSIPLAQNPTGQKSTVANVLMGQAPAFKADIFVPYAGKSLCLTLPKCISSKFTFGTKLDDFMVPEFDFEGFADAAGNALYYSLSE